MKKKIHIIQLGSIHIVCYGKEQIQLVETSVQEKILQVQQKKNYQKQLIIVSIFTMSR